MTFSAAEASISFAHDRVEAAKFRACFDVAASALQAQVDATLQRVGRSQQAVVMPYWQFLCAAILSFVGSDFLLVQPVGFWPVVFAVSLAIFRYLYFAVLVTMFLEPVVRRAEQAVANRAR